VLIEGANDTVGDATGATTTLVSGNTNDGIDVSGTGAQILYGYIGVDVTGLAALGNGGYGISLLTGADGAMVAGAVVSGNFKDGLSEVSSNDTVTGSMIGTDANGLNKVANTGSGIVVSTAGNVTIGGTGANDRNIIAGNGTNGILLSGSSNDQVLNNYIGLNK